MLRDALEVSSFKTRRFRAPTPAPLTLGVKLAFW